MDIKKAGFAATSVFLVTSVGVEQCFGRGGKHNHPEPYALDLWGETLEGIMSTSTATATHYNTLGTPTSIAPE